MNGSREYAKNPGSNAAIVRNAEAADRITGIRHALAEEDEPAPWTLPPSRRRKERPIAGPLPANLELILGDEIYIAKDVLSPGLRNRLLRLAAFQNPVLQSPGNAPA